MSRCSLCWELWRQCKWLQCRRSHHHTQLCLNTQHKTHDGEMAAVGNGESSMQQPLCSKVLGVEVLSVEVLSVEVLCCEAVARLVECAKSE